MVAVLLALLLAVSKGELPNDTGSDGASKYAAVQQADLGTALKIDFAAGDSVGVRQAKVTDWTPYTILAFTAVNPGKTDVHLTLTIKHAGTKGYATRVDVPVTLKPGKTAVSLPVTAMKNTNGSAPDLANVTRWYLANTDDTPVTVYLSDIALTNGAPPPLPTPPAATAAAAAVANALPPLTPDTAYHIRGKVGDQTVDLVVTVEPVNDAAPSPTPAAVSAAHGDPARLARLKAAKMPAITHPVLFDTPEADAICGALEVFPPDNPWNQVVDDWPVAANSAQIIAAIGADKPLRYNPDMGFVLVPPAQARIAVKNIGYVAESDPGPFPLPENVPIEGWPGPTATPQPLDAAQRDVQNAGGDRHASVVDPVNRILYEFYQLKKADGGWTTTQTSIFDLKSNTLRPDGWTSTDAAGLPIFPATVRYDEIARGMVEHAMRVTVRRSRRAYAAPATHFASPLTDTALPRMGERLRLKQDVDIRGFSPAVQAILKGLKKYGMFVADNGIDWAISVAPDPRIPILHEELRRLKGSDFEVVTPPKGP